MTNLADTLILLSARLRAAGLPADMEAVRSLLTAAASLDPFDPRQIRAASRSLTCTRHEHLRIHDAVFDSTFGLRVAGAAEDSGIQVEIPSRISVSTAPVKPSRPRSRRPAAGSGCATSISDSTTLPKPQPSSTA